MQECEPIQRGRGCGRAEGRKGYPTLSNDMITTPGSVIGDAIAALFANPKPPAEDVPYHDLYWSEERLLRWPD